MGGFDEPLFCGLLDAVLPNGGWVVALSHVYIDESGTHGSSPILTMGGFLFRSEQARLFSRDWAKDLAKFNLPYAHMADCALGFGHYAKMDVAERVAVEKRLIEHIKRRSVFGFSVSLDPVRYAEILDGETEAPSPYTFALMGCLTVVRRWVDRTQYPGKIAYFFEAGHEHQHEANGYLYDVMKGNPNSVQKLAYVSHSFVDKREAPPLQAADMLAWQHHHFHCRKRQGHLVARKDFMALLRHGDVALDYVDASILEFRDIYLRDLDPKKREELAKIPNNWPGKAKKAAV